MTRKHWLKALVGLFALTGCPDDTVTPGDTDTDSDTSTSDTGMTMSDTMMSTTMPPSTTVMPTDTGDTSGSTTDIDPTTDDTSSDTTEVIPPPDPVDFTVTITNISDGTPFESGISPGVFVVHELGTQPVHVSNMAHLGNGLAELAEDGNPVPLDDAMDAHNDVSEHGIFDTPDGAGAPAPILPGESYTFTVTQPPLDSRLSIFAMLGETNDIFMGTGPNGIGLYLPSGDPQSEDDVSDVMEFWDVGTEANQSPASGSFQQPRQGTPNTGPDETGMISMKSESTHAIPLAPKLVDVNVTEDMKTGEWTVEITNISDATNAFVSPFSPATWALVDDTVTPFEIGDNVDDLAGLEDLAEDGDGSTLEGTLGGLTGVDTAGTTATNAGPGETMSFVVSPDATNRFVWFASMVVWTNDAFMSMTEPVALLDDMGNPRNTAAIERDFERLLQFYDAGSEQNEASGLAGPNNGENQNLPGTGTDTNDPIDFYWDTTNDFDPIDNLITVSMVPTANPNEVDITITNNGLGTGFEGLLTDIVWAVHDGTTEVFADGEACIVELEELAEDGETAALVQYLMDDAGVDQQGVEGALAPGESTTFTLTIETSATFFSFWTMVVPSNDTFVSLGGSGIDTFDGGASLATEGALDTLIAANLAVWDAGTEGNQAGAGGGDMPLVGAGTDVGPTEGTGLIRQVEDDPTWAYPPVNQMVSVVVTPIED